MVSLAVVSLPGSGRLQLFVGGLIQGSISLWQTGDDPGSWTPASSFPLYLPDPSGSICDFGCVAACQNQNSEPQVWGNPSIEGNGVSNVPHGRIYTCYKNPGSTDWTQPELLPSQPTTNTSINALAAGQSADGRIQLFAAVPDYTANTSTLFTCWQSVPNKQNFNPWQKMNGAPILSIGEGAIAVQNLSDKRLQLWCCTSTNQLYTCWKESTKKNAPWTSWTPVFLQPGTVYSIAGGVRADGRVQLWCLEEPNGVLITSIQSSSPSVTFPSWTPVSLPGGVNQVYNVTVGKLVDTRIQLFIIANNTQKQGAAAICLYTCWQSNTAASASWSPWVELSTSI
jgi:hypothetical protein